MPRLSPVDRATASAPTRKLLDGVERQLGMVPNLIATMAQSHAVADAFQSFSGALTKGVLPARLREQIALTVGHANECRYCLAAHSAVASSIGLSADEIRDARARTSPSPKTEAALRFAGRLVDERGRLSDADVEGVRAAGYDEPEIAEIVAHVALNTFTNYFNHVAETEIDFPALDEATSPT